ncbi:NAD(P)H-binding protein [Microbispora sp. NPDC046973]|uniref:NAD(P)H-binding protein n=1 Tax=Microbispora sp. NPDC046973 TaxID=3155022 RepID=UPI0033FE47EA
MILVTGATGNVGSELVEALLGAGERVRALVRNPGDAALPPDTEPVEGDLNRPESLTEAFDGVRGVFLLPGYDDMPGLLARARRAGVERIVLLTGGSAALEDMTNAVSRYMTLSERAVRASGLPWTILRPRSFMSNALRWLPQLAAGDVVRVPFAGVRTAAVDPFDIAAVAARALLDDGHDGLIHEVTGPQALLPADQVAVLAGVLGRDLRCEGLTNAEARAEMEAQMPAQYVDAFFRFFADGTLDESRVHPTVREVTGRPPRTFEQWANAHADAFRRT